MNPAWIFITIGTALTLLATYRILFGFFSMQWPRVEAQLKHYMVETHLAGSVGGFGRVSRVKIKYTYSVGDTPYHGHRYAFNGGGLIGSDTISIGETLMVSYHPRIPSLSVARPGVTPNNYVLLIAGLVFLYPLLTIFKYSWIVGQGI